MMMIRDSFAAMLLVAVSLTACSGVFGSEDVLVMEVGEATVPCVGVAAQECLIVRMGGAGEWERFAGTVVGFVPEPGYRYRLRVSRHQLRNVPADASSMQYRLVRVESKERSPRHDEIVRLRQQLALWRNVRPAPYGAVVERVCFCTPAGRGPVRVQVAVAGGAGNENVLDRHYLADGSRVPQEMAEFFPGVEGLFALIGQALATGAAAVDVEYHATLGYPVRVYIDQHAGIADDEVEYRVLAVGDA
jgi:hypothetical protein